MNSANAASVPRAGLHCLEMLLSTRQLLRQAGSGMDAARFLAPFRHSFSTSLLMCNAQSAAPASSGPTPLPPPYSAQTIPLRTGRPRLVILGTGWAAARLARDIDPKLYDITIISMRNHMVFTPLLASTTVGTLSPRSVAVHITDIQPAIYQPQNQLYIAEARAVFPERKLVECSSEDGLRFYVNYDALAICTGSQGSTFGIPGVLEHAHFLRDVKQAEAIHHKLTELVAKSGIPGRPIAEYQRLLHIVIIGGGPTGVEVAGELSDFINEDLKKRYPDRARSMRVTLIEAKEVLGSFDSSLREYAARRLIRLGVNLRKAAVKKMDDTTITLHDGTEVPYGLCIWSTGVGPTPFSLSLPFAKTPVGRLAVDEYLRILAPPKMGADGTVRGEGNSVPTAGGVSQLTDESDDRASKGAVPSSVVPDVYALGDVCANVEKPLPALAQVAEQQGHYLASMLNQAAKEAPGWQPSDVFTYRSLGSMATVGGKSAVLHLESGSRFVNMAGFASWVAWRSAYLTRLGSIPKRMMVAFDWFMTFFFGRDMSRW